MTMTVRVEDVLFHDAVHDLVRGSGRQREAKSSATRTVTFDREFGLVIIEDANAHASVWVPVANVRSMRIATRETTVTLPPAAPAPSKRSA